MKIGRNWLIESDNLIITLAKKKHRKSKDGTEYDDWETIGYFARIGDALEYLITQGVRDTHLKDLKTVCAKIDELEKMIQTALKSSVSHTGASK